MILSTRIQQICILTQQDFAPPLCLLTTIFQEAIGLSLWSQDSSEMKIFLKNGMLVKMNTLY